MQPLLGDGAIALVVNVAAVGSACRLSVDVHVKAHGPSSRSRSHDEMQIARVKATRDPPVGLVQQRGLFPDGPITGKRPFLVPPSGLSAGDPTRGRCPATLER